MSVKMTIDRFGVDKKLNVNYNSVGMQISCSLEVSADATAEDVLEAVKKARTVLEGLLDTMIVESASNLQKLQQKASKPK